MTHSRGRSRPLAHLSTFLGTYRSYGWTVVLYATGVGFLALATPVAVQALVNTVAFGTVLQPLVVLVSLLLLGLTFAGILTALKSWAVEVLQRRTFVDVVAQLAYLLPRLEPSSSERAEMAHPTHRFFELFSIHKAAASLLLSGVDVVLAALVGMLVLAFYHPLLLAFDVALTAAMLLIIFGLGRNGVSSAIEESNAKYAVASFLSAVESTPYAFRTAQGRDYASRRLDALTSDYLTARAGHFRVVLRQFIGALTIQAVASSALLGLGGFLVMARELTLGQLVAAELIVTAVVSALGGFGKHLESYYDLVAGVYKLDKLLDLPTESEADEAGDKEVGSGPARITFTDAHLTAGDQTLLDAADLSIEAGERILLSGPAESGKTSIAELLFGLRKVQRGRVLIDGTDIRELARTALRERVAIVRGIEIVPGSVIDNVRMGRENISQGRIRALLEDIGLADELSRLPNGVDTDIGPGGARLSESQAWRLTLARALIGNPGFVAIDTDLTSIAADRLAQVMDFITRPDAPWTLVIVGDAPFASARCTRKIRLANGKFHAEVNS